MGYEQTAKEEYLKNDNSWNTGAPLDPQLMIAAEPDMRVSEGENAELITKQSLLDNGVEENAVLRNLYDDAVMGKVILNPLNDSSYRKPTYRPDITGNIINREAQWCFTWSEGAKSILTNPFRGMELSEGCTISFWMRIPNYFSLTERNAIMTFLGDLKWYEHPDQNCIHSIENSVKTTPYLTFETNLCIGFQEAYQNIYCKDTESFRTTYSTIIPPYRKALGRKWEFITYSITDEDIETYVNGQKVAYETIYKGKRFNGGNGQPGNSGMHTLTEFLSDEDTNLFLGLTITSDEGKCDQIMYKDINFYDSAASEEEAVALFHEAISAYKPQIQA